MLKNYIKIAWKVLLRRKIFTTISLFGISFTLMVLMIVTALVDHLFIPAKPGTNLDRTLHAVRIELSANDRDLNSFPSYYFLNKFLKPLKTPELVAIHSMPMSIGHAFSGNRLSLQQKFTDSEFWEICELTFKSGRSYDNKAVQNADYVAVISEVAENQLYPGESAIGKYIDAFGARYRVIGVIEKDAIPNLMVYADIFVPYSTSQEDLNDQKLYGEYAAFVMAKDKDDFDDIRGELNAHLEAFTTTESDRYTQITCYLGDMVDFIAGEMVGYNKVRQGKTIILTAFGIIALLFMLLPAVNLININLSRIAERSSEIGVRKAFGASSVTLIGQFLVENVIITLLGGAIGLVLAVIVLEMFNSSGFIPFGQFSINIRIFVYSLLVCLFFGVFSGVYPAYRMSKMHAVEALRGVRQ